MPVDHNSVDPTLPQVHLRLSPRLPRLLGLMFLLLLVALMTLPAAPTHSQDSLTPTWTPTIQGVFVEAFDHANIRSGPGVDYDVVGEIKAGQQYPMVGRSAQFPWYLIQLPNTLGWVYVDVVKVTGNFNRIPFTETIITPGAPAQIASATPIVATVQGGTQVVLPSDTPAVTSSVMVEAISVANVRYGPGVDSRRIGQISKGLRYAALRRHTQFPWIEIAFDESPSGRGWVLQQTVTVTGNLLELPAIGDNDFGYPTLTPTGVMVVTAVPPNSATPSTATDPKLEFLGNTVYDLLLKNQFDPHTERQASVFIQDLTTKQTVSLNPGVAYSAVSMMKIPVMLSYYRKFGAAIQPDKAKFVANMLVCSENSSSNTVLRYMGDGDDIKGAHYVTETMQMLGLKDTFITRPFSTGKVPGTATPTPLPEDSLKTDADQVSASPDHYSQTTPADLGWLLSDIYQCANDGTGPIADTFKGDVTMMECRQIINTMRYNKIGSLVEAGLPPEAKIAHKHGWGDDTHGDAALVITPGGDFVLVAILYNKDWLKSEESFPLVAEVARLTYNTFNPAKPLQQTHLETVPADCTYPPQLITDLGHSEAPPIK